MVKKGNKAATAEYYVHYKELIELLQDTQQSIRIRYTELYRILCLLLTEGTADSKMDFSGPFARLTYVADRHQLSNQLRQRLNSLRGRCRELRNQDSEDLIASFPYDARSVAELIFAVTQEPVPEELLLQLPRGESSLYSIRRVEDYMRVCVISWDDTFISCQPDDTINLESVRVCYADPENRFGDWSYLKHLLREGSQLNLIRSQIKESVYYPELIILEPDYLMDISSVASCFQDCGSSPYAYLLHLLTPNTSTRYTLLGNLAGQMLDEAVNSDPNQEPDYHQTVKRFMQDNALSILAQSSLGDFHQEAQRQQCNIRQILQIAENEDPAFHREHLLLEPSFFCEMLGLQGRMDLLQDDFHVLMEQKSGKRDFHSQGHKEPHYVQMLLYQALLHYSMHLRNDEISSYLLYSKYPDGLIKEGPAPHLLFEALRIRNQLVWGEFRMSQGGSQVLDSLTPEHLNTRGLKGRFWEMYLRPQMGATLDALHTASPLSQAYAHRMLTFVSREHLLSKIGTPGREASGMAALWNSTLEEKVVAGNIFYGLSIIEWRGEEDGVDFVTLQCPKNEEDSLPNFRIGEPCILYTYSMGNLPDVRQAILFRASIERIEMDQIYLRLRTTQHNPRIFHHREEYYWAVEHDYAESTHSALYRSVYSLLNANPDRRDLLLCQRPPTIDATITLQGDYSQEGTFPHFNQLVLQAMQAQDYFILIGPPGTGKTSFGLMNILNEELLSNGEGVLLLSYTNRAIDEICSKLVEQGLDFIRLGAPQTCLEAYRPYLLSNRIKKCTHINQIRELLLKIPVYVGTTTTVMGHQDLFALRSFGLAIFDEASQILEPHLLGILCARGVSGNAIRRFVLIGDHKQLPAVVQQDSDDSAVTDPNLNEIGLFDCRESLFQRLLRMQQKWFSTGDSPFVFRFVNQGRMHPEVSEFANRMFYDGKLTPIPLPHQLANMNFPKVDEKNALQQRLAFQRVLFLPAKRPVHSDSPKVNDVEATMVAQVVYEVYLLYSNNDRPFLPNETIGVIVPYRHQIAVVRRMLAKYQIPELTDITIDTVERYQGSQRDVIIYGFTVQYPYQLDFLCSQSFEEDGICIDRKLNVALTRAREQIILIGNPDILSLDPIHKTLLSYLSAKS